MKRVSIFLIAFSMILGLFFAFSLTCLAAGVTTNEASSNVVFGEMNRIVFSWTSNASGAASGSTTMDYSGVIYRVVFEPGSGATQPTNLYDVTLTDDDGIDILDGAGGDLSNTTTEQLQGLVGVSAVANSKLTLTVSNAGSSKTGTVVVYLR